MRCPLCDEEALILISHKKEIKYIDTSDSGSTELCQPEKYPVILEVMQENKNLSNESIITCLICENDVTNDLPIGMLETILQMEG